MIRPVLTLLFSLLVCYTALAQRSDTSIYYFTNSGKKVLTKDSADFYRVILPPDTNIDKSLYRVYDYYTNGKVRMVATSLTSSDSLSLEGVYITYYPSGKRREISQYKKGHLSTSVTSYYPNGKMYAVFKIEDWYREYRYYPGAFPDNRPTSPEAWLGYKLFVTEMRDSTGNLSAKDGTGHVFFYDDDFKKVLEQGDVKNDKREGNWTGSIADSGKYVCIFHKGELKSGISYMNSGHKYTFNQIFVHATFGDDIRQFSRYIRKNLHYPESARKDGIRGSVTVDFEVDTDGKVINPKVTKGFTKSLDDEAVRLMKSSPLWVPAYKFGIPVRSSCSFPISFGY